MYLNEVKAKFAEEPKAGESDAAAPDNAAIDKWLAAKGGDFGKSPRPFHSKGDIGYSYDTIIARIVGDRLIINETRYSNTTRKIQTHLAAEGKNLGYKVEHKPEGYFNTSMKYKYEMGVVR